MECKCEMYPRAGEERRPSGKPVRQRAFARASVPAAGLHELSVGCKLFSYILQFKDSRLNLLCTDNQGPSIAKRNAPAIVLLSASKD